MIIKIFIISITFFSLAFSQRSQRDFERELKAQNSAIQSLKDEIETTKKRINSENKKEKSSVRKVSNLSEEIGLLQKLVKELVKEEKLLITDISRMERKITHSILPRAMFIASCLSPKQNEELWKKTVMNK